MARRLREMIMTDEWWQGIQPGSLPGVMMPNNLKVMSDLRVTADGVFWGDQNKKRIGFLNCPWRVLRKIEVGDYNMQRGNQRSAFGVGPLGVAFVAANAVHNARAKQVVDFRLIRLTDGLGKQFNFLTRNSKESVWAVLRPASMALEQQFGSLGPVPQVSTPSQSTSVADELAKLSGLHETGVLTDEEFATQKAKLLST